MAKKPNKWMIHMAKVRREHPEVKDVVELSKLAKKTYNPEQKGGTALGGDLSPSDFKADPNLPTSGGAVLQLTATQYSGGKKSRKSKAKSHKKAKSRKSKSRSHKRRH